MGLFGLTPEDVQTLQQQQDTQRAQTAAQLPLGSGGVYASSIAGSLLGRGAAGALGYQDPQIVKAQRLQRAMHETESSGVDFQSDPIRYMSIGINNLLKYNLPEQAFALQDKLKEAQQGQLLQAQAGKVMYDTQRQMLAQKEADQIFQDVQSKAPKGGIVGQGSVDAQGNLTAPSVETDSSLLQDYARALLTSRYNKDQGIALMKELQGVTVVAPGSSVIRTMTGKPLPGIDTTQPTELSKQQAQSDKLSGLLQDAKANDAPQTYIDSIQKKLDESDNKVKMISEGRPRNVMVERSTKVLTGLLAKKMNGQELSRQDYIDAIGAQGAVEMGVHAVVDPNTGTTTFVQNTVPAEYSVQTLFGGKVPGGQTVIPVVRPSGMTTNPVPGQMTRTQIGNAEVTTVQGPGARPAEAEVKVLSDADALKGLISDIGQLYNKDWVGPVAGRIGNVRQEYIGQNDPGRAEFIQKSQIYYDRLVKFITGAQMSEVETKRLVKEIPTPTDPSDVFEAKLKGVNDIINYTVKAYQQNMRQGGVRVIGGNPVSQNQPDVRALQQQPTIQGVPLQPQGNRGGFNFPQGQDQTIMPMQPPVAGPQGGFEAGKTYKDANGNRARYLGNGKWQPVQ